MRRVLVVFLLALAIFASTSTARMPFQLSAAAQQNQAGNPYVIVWVDTEYGIYHCPGSKYYGRTRYGVRMYQYQAQQKGHRPAYGLVCR